MSIISLKGNPLKKEISEKLKMEIDGVVAGGGVRPHLAIVQVGDNSRSTVYIEQKKKFAATIGAELLFMQYSESMLPDELSNAIRILGARKDIHGIILQLPLPPHFSKEDAEMALDTIPQEKDADGLTSKNSGRLMKENSKAIIPATTRGIVEMLKYYQIPVEGKHVAMIGRSNLVGKPTALQLLAMGATVTVCHKGTTDLASITKQADIIVTATGVAGLITEDYIKEGQVIIDVGISINGQGIVCGDVDPKIIESDIKIKALSPVPGGIGPMTVSGLFLNLLDLYKAQQ